MRVKRRLERRHPAVDHVVAGRDEAGFVGSEEQNHRRDLVRLGAAA